MRDEQFTQILRAINDVRDDVKEFKHEMNKRWEENDKRWEENDKRWKENDKRWEENNNKLILIKKELEEKIEQRYRDTIKIFDRYEISIENMYQENKQKLINIEKRLKIANA